MAKQKQGDGTLPLGTDDTENAGAASQGDPGQPPLQADLGASSAGAGDTVPPDQAWQEGAIPSDPSPPDQGNGSENGDAGAADPVEALVLVDCSYGKCGEVKSFAADLVEGLRLAGYIDPHPNAVAWAKG